MAEPSGKPPRKGVGDHIRAVGAYSILLGFLALGVTIATIFWSSSNANLQTDLRRSNENFARATAELSEVKSEYAQYRAQHSKLPEQTAAAPVDKSAPIAEDHGQGESQQQITLIVPTENTRSAFDGDLVISVPDTPFVGDPPRHKVIATIGSPGEQSVKIEREDVGYDLMYMSKGIRYSVRIAAAGTFSATFLVTRLGSSNKAAPNTGGRADG